MKNIQACLTSKSDLWRTPSKLYQRFMIKGYFDPCPVNPEFDGLDIDWEDKNFCNPPYSQISKWVEKAFIEMKKGKEVIMLIPARTDTQWFKLLALSFSVGISFLEGRLHFNDSKCAPFPSMIVRFSEINPYPKYQYITKKELQRFIDEGY